MNSEKLAIVARKIDDPAAAVVKVAWKCSLMIFSQAQPGAFGREKSEVQDR
jgi:hypothetical protein